MCSLNNLSSMVSMTGQNLFSTFGPYSTLTISGAPVGMATVSASNNFTKIVVSTYSLAGVGITGNNYYSSYSSGWSAFTTWDTKLNCKAMKITADGQRVVYTYPDVTSSNVYFSSWTGSAPSIGTQTLDTTGRSYVGIGVSANSNILVTIVNNGYPMYAKWNGSNYSTFTQTLETTARDYAAIGIAPDASFIVYGPRVTSAGFTPRIAYWTGTNFGTSSAIGTSTNFACRDFIVSSSNSIILMSTTSTHYFSKFNSTTGTYGEFQAVIIASMPLTNTWGHSFTNYDQDVVFSGISNVFSSIYQTPVVSL